MKKNILILLLLCPFLILAQANKLIRKGLKSVDPIEKIELFSEAIAIEPNNLDAYFYRAVAKHSINDFNGAILDYTKIIFYEPSADVYFNRGNSKYSSLDYLGAVNDYEDALKMNPDFIEARYSLGVTKNDLEDYKGAIKVLDRPNIYKSYPILLQLARAYAGLKDHLKALHNYNAAVLLNPNSITFYARGVFFMDINYYEKANNDFNATIYLDKTNFAAYFFRGISSFFLGKYQDALIDFTVASQHDITDFDAVLGLALSHYKLNDLNNAKLNFEKVKSILMGTEISKKDDLELFKNTYWYQKQFYTFNKLYSEINQL